MFRQTRHSATVMLSRPTTTNTTAAVAQPDASSLGKAEAESHMAKRIVTTIDYSIILQQYQFHT